MGLRLKGNAGKIAEVLASRKAPSQGGGACFKHCMEDARKAGFRGDMRALFGAREVGDNERAVHQINFGSKRSAGLLTDETRLRLMAFKQLFNDLEIQTQVRCQTQVVNLDMMKGSPLWKDFEAACKAFNVTDFSSWIPTVNARFFFEEFELPLLISDMFDMLPMESASILVPGALGRLFGRLETDVATFGVQSNTQADYTVTAKNNVVHTEITEDLNQDSAPAIIGKLRDEVVRGVARSEDRTLVNGDDSGTHQDADVTAATDHRKAYKGLRKLSLANSANNSVYDHGGDSASKLLFANLLKLMGRFASEKADLKWIFGPSIANDLVTGAIPELFTAFAFGGLASNVTGQVPPVFGIQGVESEYQREDLADTGVYTIADQTKTALILVKMSRFANYLRQGIRVWAAPALPSSDKMLMTAKKRGAFAGIPQTADEKSVVIGINIETDPNA